MKKVLLYVLLLVVVVGLAGLGIYKYQTRPKDETLSQALTAQKTLEGEVRNLQTADAITNVNLKQTQNALTTLSSQKTQLCTLATAHKLATATLCQ